MKETDKNTVTAPSETQKRNPDVTMNIVTEDKLWDYLFDGKEYKASNRYSKPKAFYDLLQQQRLAKLTSNDCHISCGIIALAQKWMWQRATVKNFIDYLVKLDVATSKKVGNKLLIELKNISFSYDEHLQKK